MFTLFLLIDCVIIICLIVSLVFTKPFDIKHFREKKEGETKRAEERNR